MKILIDKMPEKHNECSFYDNPWRGTYSSDIRCSLDFTRECIYNYETNSCPKLKEFSTYAKEYVSEHKDTCK